jgi:hypothetical protein
MFTLRSADVELRDLAKAPPRRVKVLAQPPG